jgi:ABC-2 type transport system permease protein
MGTQIWAFVYKNWVITKRTVFSLFEIFFWPVVGLFSVGLLTVFLRLDGAMTAFILTGVIAMSVIQVCQIDVAYTLLYDLWAKSMKHIFISPAHPALLILGSWIMGMIRSVVVLVLLLGASGWAFDFTFLKPGGLGLAVFLFGLFLTSLWIGIAVCILVLLFGYKAEVAAWSITSLMALVCGIYYPVSILPGPLAALARVIPLTWFLEYYRSYYGFETGPRAGLLAWGFGLTAAYLLVEAFLFRRVLHRARRTGTLLRLSE